MSEVDAVIKEIIPRGSNVKSFRFEAAGGINFKAGQFFSVTINVEERPSSKYFSFSNSPTEKGYWEFTKRITQSPFSRALVRLKVGDTAHLKLPYGTFTFEGEHKKIAMLSGGIGVTPLRSICRYIADKGLPADVVLLFGNSTEKDIIFKDDFDAIAERNKNIRVVYTLTSSDIGTGWCGKRGYIDEKMIMREIPDFKERVFFICGPPQMVRCLTDLLRERLRTVDDRIKLENFTGY